MPWLRVSLMYWPTALNFFFLNIHGNFQLTQLFKILLLLEKLKFLLGCVLLDVEEMF